MTILPLYEQHVPAVADLHCRSLSGLLTQLGRPAARTFYSGCVSNPLAMGFTALDGDRVCGFVLGSTSPVALKHDLLSRRPFAITAALILGVLRQPPALGWLLKSLGGPDGDRYDLMSPELTYLAVAPPQRGSGIGRHLVDIFTQRMCVAGEPSYELSVDESNTEAITFYERLGLTRVGRYREFGLFHLRYRRQTGESDGKLAE